MQAWFYAAALLASATLAGQHTRALSAEDSGKTAAASTAIAAFQAKDQMLQNAGWQLARGNAEFCASTLPSIGLQLQDLASYRDPEEARAVLGLKGDFAVQTAARGSPSAMTGLFRPNREIVRIDAVEPNQWEADERMDWRRLMRLHGEIDDILEAKGEVTFHFGDGTNAQLSALLACATRFELASTNSKAVADGTRVVIGARFVGFSYQEEIFAAAVAHEFAHNVLGHRAWLDRNKRKRKHVRLTEREADRLMPWLMANAGYDPRAAVTFMETWGPRHGGGLFRKRTHDGWDERAKFIAAELPLIEDLMERTGKADWRANFRREIDPDKGV